MPNLSPVPVPPSRPLVAVLAYDGLCTFEFAVAYEIFGLNRPELGPDWYRYLPVAVEPGPLRANGGLMLDGQTNFYLSYRYGAILQ